MPPLCAMVSITLHYFMLVVFMVMAAEAVNLYMKLVVMLGQVSISHYVIKVSMLSSCSTYVGVSYKLTLTIIL